ncbi:MAG: hypothetical protein FWH51_02080 [Dehalococcoidia bacterium]|nr:hypothetical protein [Dehalococcoidia bacterium]
MVAKKGNQAALVEDGGETGCPIYKECAYDLLDLIGFGDLSRETDNPRREKALSIKCASLRYLHAGSAVETVFFCRFLSYLPHPFGVLLQCHIFCFQIYFLTPHKRGPSRWHLHFLTTTPALYSY